MHIIFCHFSTYSPATEMHLVQHFSKVQIPLWKNCCSWSSSQPFAMQVTFSASGTVSFHEFFQFRKNRSHLEPGQGTWSHVSSSTCCHPKCQNVTNRIHHSHSYCMANCWLEDQELLQWNQSFGEMLDQVHLSCRILCKVTKVTKYDLCIS